MDVSRLLQGLFQEGSKLFKRYFMGVLRVFQGFLKKTVSSMFQGSFRMCYENFKCVSRKFQEWFKSVPRV